MSSIRTLDACHSIDDLQQLARRRLPSPIYEYLIGAAESESTARRNIDAFSEVRLVPRCMVDVSAIDTSLTLMGQRLDWPVYCSSTGASRFYHPEGELAVARAAAKSGTLYSLAVAGTHSLEEVAAATTGPKMFQLFVFKDRGLTLELIQRCQRAGFQALCLTIDVPVRGKRERELRSGMGVPPRLSLRSLASIALHPTWFIGQGRKGPLSMSNIAARSGGKSFAEHSKFFGEQLDPSVTWKDIVPLIAAWRGPFVIKGVLSVDDARCAVDVGATAIMVSNHGGRQLDGAVAPLDVLPDIASAVGDRTEVILDGGIRRGGHVLKALALGAKACSIGRACLYGLGAGGEAGVSRALALLRSEFVRAMQLCGKTKLGDIDRSLVRP